MLAFHGTAVRGLQALTPFANPHSNLKYPCVYLSTNRALAAVYIWNKPYKWMTFQIREDGLPVYQESFKHGLRELYGGVSGCIYTCRGDFATDDATTIRHAVVSTGPVEIESAELVDDAYELLLRLEREGLLAIEHFETLTERQRLRDRSMVSAAIERLELLRGEHPLSGFVAEHFPELWSEATARRTAQKPLD